MPRGGVDYENLIPDVEPEDVEGIKIKKGQGLGGLSSRTHNALKRSGSWSDGDGEIDLGVLAETPAKLIQTNTPGLADEGVKEIITAITNAANQKRGSSQK